MHAVHFNPTMRVQNHTPAINRFQGATTSKYNPPRFMHNRNMALLVAAVISVLTGVRTWQVSGALQDGLVEKQLPPLVASIGSQLDPFYGRGLSEFEAPSPQDTNMILKGFSKAYDVLKPFIKVDKFNLEAFDAKLKEDAAFRNQIRHLLLQTAQRLDKLSQRKEISLERFAEALELPSLQAHQAIAGVRRLKFENPKAGSPTFFEGLITMCKPLAPPEDQAKVESALRTLFFEDDANRKSWVNGCAYTSYGAFILAVMLLGFWSKGVGLLDILGRQGNKLRYHNVGKPPA